MPRVPIDQALPLSVQATLRDLGELLAAARREQRMTQHDLASRVGVSRDTIRRMESGAGGVAVGWVLAAAWILGVPILRSSDFASRRTSSSVAAFLNQLNTHVPKRGRSAPTDPDDDF